MASTESAIQNGVNGGGTALTSAQRLARAHELNTAHQPTIEDIPDDDDLPHGPQPPSASVLEPVDEIANPPGWVAPLSAKAAGKRKAEPSPGKENQPTVDTQSEELFPALGGAPKPVQISSAALNWSNKKAGTNGTANGVSTNGSSTPTSGLNTPPPATSKPAPRVAPPSLAGQTLGPSVLVDNADIKKRGDLKKPIPDVLKDIAKKSRPIVNITQTIVGSSKLRFTATGPAPDAAKWTALRDLGAQIGVENTQTVSIPRSARAHIIGKQGSTIKSLQEKTGARIQMPKMEDTPEPVDEDDDMLDITIKGNPMALEFARKEIVKIASERTATVNSKLRTIPAELYPFIAGPHNTRANALEETHGVQIRVPPYHTWTSQPPPSKPLRGQAPAFIPAVGDNHITIAGDRVAVQTARAEIERITEELRRQLTLQAFSLTRGQHQFIIGERGIPAEDFFADTGCAIILPGGDNDEDEITIVGPADQVEAAVERAIDLAGSVNSTSFDISKQHRNAPGGARVHARNVTQYLRERKEIERIEKLHQTQIVTPLTSEGADPWQLYYRDGKNSIRAQTELNNIIAAHPPSRMATLPVNEFFHQYLKADVTPRVKKDYGVHVVLPSDPESGAPILLVFEGESGLEPDYQVPRGQPSLEEIAAFHRGIQDARKHIQDIIGQQESIITTSIDVPKIFHEKLRRFIQREQQQRPPDQIPARVTASGTIVSLRGPESYVNALTAKVNAFVEEAIQDEKERDFTLSFEFPQKHANQLIGKAGSHISQLRERFDVEINVNDGKVELKGPEAKAKAAKAHILTLGKQWADETTYTLKIDPKYHRELIGPKGAQINRLQTRHKVQIHFPRSAKPVKDDQSSADAASEAGRRGPRREQEPDEVIVKGPKKGADDARNEILELLQYEIDNSHTAIVSVQASQIPSLIGQRGAGMEDIRMTTGARIDIPNARDIKDPTARVEIRIKGQKAHVAQAKKLIEEKKEIFDQTVTKTLSVDKRHHKALIGQGGSALKEIVVTAGGSDDNRELARTVQFPKVDADGNLIKIQGKAAVVDKIIARMQAIVAERESQTTETLDVPTDQHRKLIGRGGDIKKGLESKFKVSIDVPRQNSGQTSVKISGLPADVEKAKTHILGLVKEEAEGETVQVPRGVHHGVANNGAFFKKLRHDHQVTVDHGGHKVPPKPEAPPARANGDALPLITDDAADAHSWTVAGLSTSDIDGEIPWILRGPPDNLVKAREALLAAIEEAHKNDTVGYLRLPDPHTYRYVIGQGGNKVNSIRKATGCKITVPRDQSSEEAIEIIGTSEGVEKTKDLILQAVKEGISNTNGGGRGNGNGNGNGNNNWD